MDFNSPLEDDMEPTPLAMPHQIQLHRVSLSSTPISDNSNNSSRTPKSKSNTNSAKKKRQLELMAQVDRPHHSSSPMMSGDNLVSDSDGGPNEEDEEEDDDFHSAASQDEFHLIPEAMDIIFGRGQPLRDHPGNMRLRGVIKRYTTNYRDANKQEKTKIIQQIVQAASGNGARFLVPHNNQEPTEGCRPATQAEIRGKISHGLRDAIKVEDLLDSEFVQLWSNEEEPRQIPTYSHSPPLQPIHQPSSLMMMPPPMLPQPGHHHRTSFTSLHSQRTSPGVSGPAIYHVSVQNNETLITDKTADDNSTLDSAEKGLSSVRNTSDIHPCAIATPANKNHCSKLHKTIFGVATVVIVALVVLVTVSYTNRDGSSSKVPLSPTASPTTVPLVGDSSTLEAIVNRGYLRCGFGHQEGYSIYDSDTGSVEGFEVDLCRAVAAGIFGRENFGKGIAEPVEYTFLELPNRFLSLNNDEIDVLFSVTTHTMEREVYEPTTKRGYAFSTPYLINGLMFAGQEKYVECADNLNITAQCSGIKICCLDGSTHIDVVESILPQATVITAPTFDALHLIYQDGGCHVVAGEQLDIVIGQKETNSFYLGSKFHSHEPIAIVTRDDDPKFSDFCNWILQSLFSAEELKGNSSSASLSDFPIMNYFGEKFDYMFLDAVTVVGDYGNIYERHLSEYITRSNANRVNTGVTPLMFVPPLGTLQPDAAPSQSGGGTIESIRDRGFLRCGITQSAIFAELASDATTWSGLDVAFCEAASAAIFDGAVHVRYTILGPTERFVALKEDRVDVLARVTTITLERDVLEPTSGVGFAFSPPNFYDEYRMGGISPYLECADNLDTTSDVCDDLMICVTEGTTQSASLAELIPSDHILECADSAATIERFVKGSCNVIAGGYVELTPANLAVYGYTGEFQMGEVAFSRESLALVTREDDVLFSKFIEWVVYATIYAEAENITQATYHQMPEVDLFKPLVNDEMFRNVIRAVGSYAEIWDKTAAVNGLERFGRNILNIPPVGPQLMSDLLWDKPDL